MDKNYISVAEFQAAHPEIDISQYTEATISGMISDVSRYADDYCQTDGFDFEVVVGEKAKALITNKGDLHVMTRKFPIETVNNLVLKKGLTSLTLTLTQGSDNLYELPSDDRHVVYPNSVLTSTGTFSVNTLQDLRGYDFYSVIGYNGGYRTIPRPVKRACILLLKDILSKRLNVAGASSVSQGGISIKYSERDGDSDDMVDAKQLLDQYRRVVPV